MTAPTSYAGQMTDDALRPVRPPESQRMTGSELTIARSRLGLTRADLARVLSAGENTVRRWEIGKDPVSFRARDVVSAIEKATEEAVDELVTTLKELSRPQVVVYREHDGAGDEPPGLAAYGPGWWRAVAGLAAAQVPGTRVGTREELDAINRAEST